MPSQEKFREWIEVVRKTGQVKTCPGEGIRQRPTFPRGLPRSIISAEGLNYRVRDGYGWFPFAIATGKFFVWLSR